MWSSAAFHSALQFMNPLRGTVKINQANYILVPAVAISIFASGSAQAQQKGGLFGKLFGKKTETSQIVTASVEATSETSEVFPSVIIDDLAKTDSEKSIDARIESIYVEYADRVAAFNAKDLQFSDSSGESVPSNFDTAWSYRLQRGFWSDEDKIRQGLDEVYARALAYSNQVKVLSDIPLIRETGIQEAEGEFDVEAFADATRTHVDEPTSSELTTGFTGRLREDQQAAEAGFSKKLETGAEVTLSNRINHLKSNSTFITPNPQSGSNIVLSVAQPLLRGAGIGYNTARIKIAKLDAESAATEYVRQLEAHLLEVNRAYWGVYLSRASYLQRKALAERTGEIVGQLRDRTGVDADATRSELLRAESALAARKAALIRSEVAIRNSEERLRVLVNDPSFAIGTGGEIIPVSRPILGRPGNDVKGAATDALMNRAEVIQGFYQLRAAGIRRDLQKSELLPEVNLIGETSVAGLDANRDLGGAYHDQFEDGTGWLAGITFNQSLERNFAKSRYQRREYELRQQANSLRAVMDNVLLESVVAFRELATSYKDMQAKYQTVLASRTELTQMQERIDVDTDEQRTVGYQLQLMLDAIERNQSAEESFLVAVVAYNVAYANLERAKGTLLQSEDVEIKRIPANAGRGLFARKMGLQTLQPYKDLGSSDGKEAVNDK